MEIQRLISDPCSQNSLYLFGSEHDKQLQHHPLNEGQSVSLRSAEGGRPHPSQNFHQETLHFQGRGGTGTTDGEGEQTQKHLPQK